MKKILIALVAMFAIAGSVNAQKAPTGSQRDEIICKDMIFNMVNVGNKYAITRTPISYYLYWVVTGEKAHGPHTSVSEAAYVNTGKQQHMVNILNKESKGAVTFSIATMSQIQEAKRYGLKGDIRHHGATTLGFYLVMPYKQWKQYENTM